MENDPNHPNENDVETEGTHTLFDDDTLDSSVAAADDTGMVSAQQFAIRVEESENLPG